MDFPGGSDGKSVCLQCRRPRFDPWVGKLFLEKEMAPHSSQYSCLENSLDGRRSLVGYSPWGCKELDMIERLHLKYLTTLIHAWKMTGFVTIFFPFIQIVGAATYLFLQMFKLLQSL